MPIFVPRNRVQITRDMVARVIARSELTGMTRNSSVFHVLAAAANEDAEQYIQMSRMRLLFSIDKATGSDLDSRAAEIQPGVIVRRTSLFATVDLTFSRPGTLGSTVIPAGTIVAAQDNSGLIKYRTTASATIPGASSSVSGVNAVALTAGARANVSAGNIAQFVSRIAGVTGVTNPADVENGRDRESDEEFRGRLKAFTQSLSRGTPTALEGFARNVLLSDGRRVLFAHTFEPAIPNGTVKLFIDDGTGGIEEFDDTFIAANDLIVSPALGGEIQFFTSAKPIRDDGSFVLEVDSQALPPSSGGGFVALTRDVDYVLNPASGQIDLLDTGAHPLATGLAAGDALRCNYRFYTGLIQATQKVIDGDPADPIRFPGVRAAGIAVFVQAPTTVLQSVTASISVLDDFDVAEVTVRVQSAIQGYINALDINEDVILSEIIERAMAEQGMFDITITDLTGGSPPVNQVILGTQVARIQAASITLT